jgi:hypothetical protein
VEEMKRLFTLKNESVLVEETRKWRKKHALPRMVLLSDSDNELLVDWENPRSIQALFSIIKKRQNVLFKEFLYVPETSVVRDRNGNPYINECIVAFYKEKEK